MIERGREASDQGPFQLGTLLWIGDRTSAEFMEAYHFCESHAAQLAVRADLDEAVRRPASHVKGILVASPTRQSLNGPALQALAQKYPKASRLHLLGGLCEGNCRIPDKFFQANRHYWHRWNQILPDWLSVCGATTTAGQRPGHSVVVLASSFNKAEPLLELAESSGATAVWSRQPDLFRVRNIDVVWWDDSVARPAGTQQWRQRIASMQFDRRPTRHAWIVSAPRIHQHRQATAGGIELVISKPHRIECLMDMLVDSASNHGCVSGQLRVKAA